MLAKLKTYSLVGIEAVPVDVEVDLSPSALPKIVLVGLPEQAVRFDLPISLGMLFGSNKLVSDRLNDYAVVGEPSLEVETRGVNGA
ncbi:MAG: hypothetical protein ACK5OB_02555 [Pirellula sp.]